MFYTGRGRGNPLYLSSRSAIGTNVAALCMIGLMLPFFALGMYEKDGQPLEKIVFHYVRARFLWPGVRPFKTNNLYAALERQAQLDKEVRKLETAGKAVRPVQTAKKPGKAGAAKNTAPPKKPLKIAGPDAKMTAAEKRRVKRAIQKAQRDGKIPRDAVQTIPYREMYPDGLLRVNDKLYTKTLRFSDINYELAQPEDKEQTFDGLCDFYNVLDSSMWAQMSFINLRANLIDYQKSVTVPETGDAYDDVRRELAGILRTQLAKGNNGLIKRKYFTFGIEADNELTARPRVERMEADLRNHLKNMGVRSEPLSGYDRLEVLHGIFHPDGREKLRFNWNAIVNTGLTTKPFIAPSSFDFRGGRTFKIGGMWGAASFLQIGASQLNDRVLSDFLNLDCSLIVNIHIKAVNQQEAIKTIKRKLTDIEKHKDRGTEKGCAIWLRYGRVTARPYHLRRGSANPLKQPAKPGRAHVFSNRPDFEPCPDAGAAGKRYFPSGKRGAKT